MIRLVFDIETNGLLLDATKVHILNVADVANGTIRRYNDMPANVQRVVPDGTIVDGLAYLDTADELIGHNICAFDLPVLRRVCGWTRRPGVKASDTLIMSRFYYGDIRDADFRASAKRGGKWIPPQMIGRHSLESWGYRLNEWKGDYTGTWVEWTQDMQDYGDQDIVVSLKLYHFFAGKDFPAQALELEHDFAEIIAFQVETGFNFDEAKAAALYAKLAARRAELEAELRSMFGEFYQRHGSKDFTPKRDNVKEGYTAGAPLCKVRLVPFNPGSRHHIAGRLIRLYGWKPKEYNEDGSAKVDETTLEGLTYPGVPQIIEYLTVEKRIGQLAEGKEALLKRVRNGKIHGSVNTLGAVTHRCTHSEPNVAQTPKIGTLYGAEFRELYGPPPGYLQVGCDADALELRILAGYMARWDNGAYIVVVLEGKKEDGTDMHTRNMAAFAVLSKRDTAKTAFYAWLYGAGDYKLGLIGAEDLPAGKKPKTKSAFVRLGKQMRKGIETGLPALGELVKAVKSAARSRGRIKSIDGRFIRARAEHAALNTLIQSTGAIIMKRAMVIAKASLDALGLRMGIEWLPMANIHDEVQLAVKPEHAEQVGQVLADAIHQAGLFYNFACEQKGNYDIGTSWKECH